MRKILIGLLILTVTLSILWIAGGREISVVADQFKTRELESTAVASISYQGSGDGGALIVGNERFTLNSLNPHVGSTKENQLALAYRGKVFPLGPLRSTEGDSLSANIPAEDSASLLKGQSYIPWPTFDEGRLRLNYRNYRELFCTKSTGAKLKLFWSIEPGDVNSLNLIRVEISDVSR